MPRAALQSTHGVGSIAEFARNRIPKMHGEERDVPILSKLNHGLLRRVQFVAAQKGGGDKKIYPTVPAHLRHSTRESVLTPPEIFLEFVQASD
ncbi:hypothetical protein [Methylorubrum salsuginis]|uniref:hypothetical protein n=1 Tax=Methylorubrum salsuginis TaxID=414703 RepID=UPI0010422646|nr:hypothetical protein [Methylorubrum salsuginis]